MKKALFPIVLFIWMSPIWAQDDPAYTVEAYFTDTEIKASNEEFRTYMDEVNMRLSKNKADVWARLASGSINAGEAQSQIEALQSAYQADLKSKQQEFESKLFSGAYQNLLYEDESIEEDTDIADDFDFDFDFSSLGPKAKRNYFSLQVAFGWNTLTNRPESFPGINFWRSGFVELGLYHRLRLNKDKANSPWHWSNGLTFVQNSVRWRDNRFLADFDTPTFFTFDGNLRRNDFATGYIVYSSGFSYKASGKSKFYAELMGFAGVSVLRETHLRFRNLDRKGFTSFNTSGDFGINRFNYGITATIGLRHIALYSRYDFSSLFRNSPIGVHPWSIGVRFF